jgi:RNA polymerase sigma factor (sigma-70 family)
MPTAQLDTLVQHLRRLADAQRAAGLDDAQLLDEFVRRRDEAAFAALLNRHAPLVFGVCRRVLGNAHDAEDAFQATFLVLVRKAGSIRTGESLGCWLYEIAYRTALRARTVAHKRRARERQAHAMNEASPKSPAEAPRVDPLLDEELNRLPEQYRRPLVLCYLEGKTHAEAAEQLGWPKGTVSGRLARARDLLRRRLEKRGVTLSVVALSAALTRDVTAAVPAPLLDATFRAGIQFAQDPTAGGGASAEAVSLAKEVLNVMLTSKICLALIALAVVGFLSGGVALYVSPGTPARQVVPAGPPPSEPLPDGATARLGTTEFRHGDRILFVAFTPDGKKLVTSSMDQTVRLWDAATGRELRRFDRSPNAKEKQLARGPRKMPVGAAVLWDMFLTTVSADGKYLAANRGDVVIVWDLESGKELHRVRSNWAGGTLLAFAEGGKTLALVGHTGGVEKWDIATGKKGNDLPAPQMADRTARITAGGPAASIDGKLLALPLTGQANNNLSIKLIDLATGKDRRVVECGFYAMSLAFGPDGNTLAAGMETGDIKIWDAMTRKELASLEVKSPASRTVSLAFAPGGRELALSRADGSVEVWETKSKKRLHKLLGASIPTSNHILLLAQGPGRADLAFSPDGKRLAVGAFGSGVRVFDSATGKEIGAGTLGHPAPVRSFGLSADGKTLTTHARGDCVRSWDVATGKPVHKVAIPGGAVTATLSADGTKLAAVTAGKVVLYDTATARPKGSLANSEFAAASLTFSPDGKTLAARGIQNRAVRLWDAMTGKELPSPEGEPKTGAETDIGLDGASPVRYAGVILSPDGRYLAMKDGREQLALFEVTTGIRLRQFPLARGQVVNRFGFSADGRNLATLNKDGTVTLYETLTGRKRGRLGKAGKSPGPDPTTMISGIVLDLVPDGADTPHSLAISPDGRVLAANSSGPEIRLWDLLTGADLGTFRGHQGGITDLAFDAAGKRLVSGSMDTTALVWDLSSPAGKLRPGKGTLAAGAADKLWADLAGDDAERAFAAIQKLCDAPADAVALLKQRLRPAVAPDPKRVAGLMADLDSSSFAVRSQATAELEKLGDLIGPAARQAADDGSLEKRQRLEQILKKPRVRAVQGEALAAPRGVEVLELAGTEEARQVLEALAGGAAGSRQTEEARAALRRRNGAASK